MSQLFIDPSEKVIIKVHEHWLLFLGPALQCLLIAFAPFLLYAGISVLNGISIVFPDTRIVQFLAVWWLLVSWCALVVVWTNYYLDIWILTDKRIINVRQIGLFDRTTATWDLHRIQEITVHSENIVQTLFNFGELQIQTAGPTDEYARVRGIPNPEGVRARILSQTNELERRT